MFFWFILRTEKDLFLGIQILYFDAKIEILSENINFFCKNNNKF